MSAVGAVTIVKGDLLNHVIEHLPESGGSGYGFG
jgi:hypothetical protein